MAYNFKLTGDYYVSVDGSDSNNGLTKDTPKRTVQAALNLATTGSRTIIIGAGVYKEALLKSSTVVNMDFFADGNVVFESPSQNSTISFSVNGTIRFYDIVFLNYNQITAYLGGASGPTIQFYRCKLYNIFLSGAYVNFYLINSIVINLTGTSVGNVSFTTFSIGSIYVNSIFTSNNQIINSYFNESCFLSSVNISAANFNYNNIRCSIIMNSASTVTTGVYQDVYGRYYDLSITTSTGDGGVSTPFGRPYTNGAAFSFATHRILYPTYNVNSFSADPKFNNIEAQDFTLQVTSPHIGRASDGTNIGGTKYANRYAAKGAEFNTSAVSVTGLAFTGNDWSISGGTTGEVVSAPILISATAKVLQKISYNGLLEFNKSITGGTAGNRNVPDQEVYDSTAQPPNVTGANPDRLVYYMRYSTQTSQPSADAQWDNGGYWTAGTYGTFEWNTKPTIDNAFLGNGHPSFNSGVTATSLNVTWIQLKVKLRNDYV